MAVFESWDEYRRFADSVKCNFRHVLEPRSQQFLKVLIETSAKRKIFPRKDDALWRAQLGHGWRVEIIDDETQTEIRVQAAYDFDRMKPLADRATEGRINPKGIPCLYLSTEMDTAMSEVRPWDGSYVSLAQFVIRRNLTLVDCSHEDPIGLPDILSDEPDADKRETEVWGNLNLALSEPVSRIDELADYAPTQVIAEAFRQHGYDGLTYRSRFGHGRNVALFDLKSAEPLNITLYRATSVRFEFSRQDKPSYLVKHYPDLQRYLEAHEYKCSEMFQLPEPPIPD